MDKPKYYKSINELPLSRFIDCLVDNNLFALIISGEPEKDLLEAVWEEILFDYNEAIGDNESKMYFQLFKEVHLLLITMKEIEMNIQILSFEYDKKYADNLNALLETDFAFDFSDQEKYHKELSRCKNRSKGIFIQYEIKNTQFEALKKKNDNKDFKVNREYFQNILITLSDHAKYEIKDNITVYQFCERIKRFGQFIKTIEKRK